MGVSFELDFIMGTLGVLNFYFVGAFWVLLLLDVMTSFVGCSEIYKAYYCAFVTFGSLRKNWCSWYE